MSATKPPGVAAATRATAAFANAKPPTAAPAQSLLARNALQRELASIRRLPALWLLQLPASGTLVCSHRHLEQTLWVTTSRAHYAAAGAARFPALHGDEWRLLTRAANECKSALAVEQWLITRMPYSPLRDSWLAHGTIETLIGPLDPLNDGAGVTIGQVLEHFGLELQAIDPPPTIERDARLL